jgi:hypothetical protein
VPGPFRVESEPCDVAARARARAWRDLIKALAAWLPALLIAAGLAAGIWRSKTRWPLLTVLLYAALVVVVLMPLVFAVSLWLGSADTDLGEAFEVVPGLYGSGWVFWTFCLLLILCQILLLVVPVGLARERPRPRRGIWATILAAAALFALLTTCAVWSVAVAAAGDAALDETVGLTALGVLVLSWIGWSFVFRSFARHADPRSYVRRQMKWLMRGSVLELLIAVPSHVIVRQREECCAHGVTALGIATGLVVMLFSFGPGIYFLYAERIKARKAGRHEEERS